MPENDDNKRKFIGGIRISNAYVSPTDSKAARSFIESCDSAKINVLLYSKPLIYYEFYGFYKIEEFLMFKMIFGGTVGIDDVNSLIL